MSKQLNVSRHGTGNTDSLSSTLNASFSPLTRWQSSFTGHRYTDEFVSVVLYTRTCTRDSYINKRLEEQECTVTDYVRCIIIPSLTGVCQNNSSSIFTADRTPCYKAAFLLFIFNVLYDDYRTLPIPSSSLSNVVKLRICLYLH